MYKTLPKPTVALLSLNFLTTKLATEDRFIWLQTSSKLVYNGINIKFTTFMLEENKTFRPILPSVKNSVQPMPVMHTAKYARFSLF